MISSGRLDKRITVLAPSVTLNDFGEERAVWTETGTFWATIQAKDGSCVNAYGEIFLTQTIKVWTRWHEGVTERSRIKYEGNVYQIKNLDADKGEGKISFNLEKIETE